MFIINILWNKQTKTTKIDLKTVANTVVLFFFAKKTTGSKTVFNQK